MTWIIIALLWVAAYLATRALYRSGRLMTPWHRDVAGTGLLALLTVGFFWRVLSGQNYMPADGGDLVSFLFPTYRFAASSLTSGAFPLWNPFLYGGMPHVGDIQSGFLYPPNLLLFLTRPGFTYSALPLMSIWHIWLAGAGMFLFLSRGLNVCRVAALAGAVPFMFADPFLTHFGNLNFNAVMSWTPWIFWSFTNALRETRRGGMRYAAVAGVALAIATLAGHIQGTLFLVLALVTFTAAWVWLERKEHHGIQWPPRFSANAVRQNRSLRPAVYLATCLLVGVALAAPVIMPALELAPLSSRAGWNYTQAAGYSLSPAQWIGWLVPGFFGRGPQFHWGAWPRVESGYIGILTLVLAGLGLAMRRDKRTRAIGAVAGVSFVLALGIYAIPHGWLTLLPGFGQLRAPGRMLLLTDFGLAAMAAVGLHAVIAPLTQSGRAILERAWRLTGSAAAVFWALPVPLTYLALLITQAQDPAITLRISITLIAVVTAAGLITASFAWLWARRSNWEGERALAWIAVGLIFLDVASLGAYQDLGERDPSAGFEQTAIVQFLEAQPGPFRIDTRTDIQALWQPDTALQYRLEDVGGLANPLALADSERYWGGLGSRSTALYDLLNVRYLIARKDVELDWQKFRLAFDGDPKLNVYENTRALPRALVVGNVRAADSHEAAWSTIQTPGFDPARTVVVERAAVPGGGQGEVTGIRNAANRVEIDVVADGPVVLVVSQPWYAGWRVQIDGKRAPLPLRADYLFQGIPLVAGSHTVTLNFLPLSWLLGWLLAIVTAIALIVFGVVAASNRRAILRI